MQSQLLLLKYQHITVFSLAIFSCKKTYVFFMHFYLTYYLFWMLSN